jgi:hypothetical protein
MTIGQKQRLASMRFFLFERALHPELFDIYDDVVIDKSDWQARLWVTGCTHVLSFSHGEQTVSEVIASEEVPLPQRGLSLELPFRGEKSHQRLCFEGISYMMNFQLEQMSPKVYQQTHRELARQGARRGIFVPFPFWRENALTPFTYVTTDTTPDELHVMTFHAFPEATTILKTQSLFEIR